MIHAMLLCWYVLGAEPRVFGVPHNQAVQLAGDKGMFARRELCRVYGQAAPVKSSLVSYEYLN